MISHVKCSKSSRSKSLGSAAGYSSFPIHTFTTKELGFETLKYNSVAAQMSRGKSENTFLP
jgi:argininosuccinate lyase